MRMENPACYECPKGKDGLHTWKKVPVGERVGGKVVLGDEWRACCTKCHLVLDREFSDDVYRE